jgi:hypothetical protein
MQKAKPWWLTADDEECPDCSQGYAYELVVRCVDCDAPMCPGCVIRRGKLMLCRACADRPEE